MKKSKQYYLSAGIETISLIEDIMERQNIPPVKRYMIGNALKYLIRIGKKTPQYEDDLLKAEDYLHRARTGEWLTQTIVESAGARKNQGAKNRDE